MNPNLKKTMDTLIRNASFETPAIELDPRNGRLEFSGRSLPEDSATFFKPILTWIDEYVQEPRNQTDVEIKLEYFNTATSMVLMKIFSRLQKIENVKIHWFHYPEDEDMLESGKEFEELSSLNFVYHEFS
jgi:hypothetical protein